MKIRNGFVSNSSSSSFIVAFPVNMEITPATIENYVFGGQTSINYYDYSVSVTVAAEKIYRQMKDQKPTNLDYLREKCNGWIGGAPEYDDFKTLPNGECDWDAYTAATDKYRDEFIDRFIRNASSNMVVYAFEFSDDTDCALEHGGTFDNVMHERISNH